MHNTLKKSHTIPKNDTKNLNWRLRYASPTAKKIRKDVEEHSQTPSHNCYCTEFLTEKQCHKLYFQIQGNVQQYRSYLGA